jgi:hypothetical protein
MMKRKMNAFLLIALVPVAISSCSKKSNPTPPPVKTDTTVVRKPSPVGDVVGKVIVGYQGWFAAIGDGSPIDRYWHWTQIWEQQPSPTNTGISAWPDVREYTSTFPTKYPNLNNGQPATVFSSFSDQTVDIQFKWMKDYGIDGAALQRFNPSGLEGPVRDAMAAKVKIAAEKNAVKFYIMYDVSGWTNMATEMEADWTNKMSALTSSPQYAKQNGKPVVCIWGFGFSDDNHNFTSAACTAVIKWFQSKGCYVIGGVPTHWRDQNSDSRPDFLTTYKTFDMLSPWMVGRIGNANESDGYYANTNKADEAYCRSYAIDYQPCILPGDLSARQRAHGDFMWRQFYNMTKAGAQGLYISMYDEFNEGNQIVKTAESQAFVPAGPRIITGGVPGPNFMSLDEDGTACSSDYYLRLTGDGAKMFKGLTPLTATRPTKPMP